MVQATQLGTLVDPVLENGRQELADTVGVCGELCGLHRLSRTIAIVFLSFATPKKEDVVYRGHRSGDRGSHVKAKTLEAQGVGLSCDQEETSRKQVLGGFGFCPHIFEAGKVDIHFA